MPKMVAFAPMSEKQKELCAKLGEIVIRWNNAEALLRLVLFGAIDPPRPSHRIDIITSGLSNVALCEAVTAIAETHDPEVRQHLEYCAKLFDRNRLHRNIIVHDAILMAETSDGDVMAYTQTVTAKGGKLRIHQGQLPLATLDQFLKQIFDLSAYIQEVLGLFWKVPGATPAPLIDKPPLPEVPKKLYHSPIAR